MNGCRITVLGSGNVFCEDGRAHASFLVEHAGGHRILVDCGPTTLLELRRHEVRLDAVDTVLITHFHGDHLGGLPLLALARQLHPHEGGGPLEVVGPRGLAERYRLLWQGMYPDLPWEEPHWHELPPTGGRLDRGGVQLEAVPMTHREESLGYRLLGECRVGFSGDTTWGSGVPELARDLDLLFLDCTYVEPSPRAHLSLAELREHRHELACPRVILVHVHDAVAQDLAGDPLPGVTAAEDGMVLTVEGQA
jgi:ribonuclease BN (tRNA processing enzyme)